MPQVVKGLGKDTDKLSIPMQEFEYNTVYTIPHGISNKKICTHLGFSF